jgi:SAM-dependent methyltransferase
MPPRRVRLIGRALSIVATRAPWLWPLIRRPVTAFWNRMAASWDDGASAARTQSLAAALPRMGAPRRILEVGTGTGSGAALLAEQFPEAEVTGVDLSAEMVRAAQTKVPSARFEVGDAGRLPFPDGSFDLVAQNNVPVYFRELARVTAPGGRILITSTFGPATPYYTPHDVLQGGFAKLGFTELRSEQAPPGDWFSACKPA